MTFRQSLASIVLTVAVIFASGCAGGVTPMPGSGVLDPISPEDVHDIVQLGTSGYLIAHPLPAGQSQKLVAYLKQADGLLTQDRPDLAKVKAMLVTEVPQEWRGLAAAGSGLIARRVHIENLVESGQTKLAVEYLRAAIMGVVDAMVLTATPARLA